MIYSDIILNIKIKIKSYMYENLNNTKSTERNKFQVN